MLPICLKSIHDNVYVLTLKNAKDRQANVVSELGENNFEFIYGVDKNSVTKQELIRSRIYDEELARSVDRRDKIMTTGHICCSLGHRMIYEKVIERSEELALIFEDDVTSIKQENSLIQEVISNIPKDADLIYWGWSGGKYNSFSGKMKQITYHIQHSMGLLKYNHKMIQNLYPRPYNKYFDIAGKHFLAHAYTINQKAAKALLNWNTPIKFNADNAIMYAILNGDIKAYISKTILFNQRSADKSDTMQSLTSD